MFKYQFINMNEKILFLVRHAKSSWKDPSLNDHDRPLNKRGEQNAPLMAARLRKRGIIPKIILSSTANRAVTTSKIFAQEIGIRENQINYQRQLYHASVEDLITIIKAISDKFDSVMLCGHGFVLAYYEWNLQSTIIPPVSLGTKIKVDSWNDIADEIHSPKFVIEKFFSNSGNTIFVVTIFSFLLTYVLKKVS